MKCTKGEMAMPIYEFRCQKCGHRFEKLCPVGEDGNKLSCPRCQAGKPKRVMSSFSARGTGKEYETGGGPGAANSGCGTCSSSSCGSCGL